MNSNVNELLAAVCAITFLIVFEEAFTYIVHFSFYMNVFVYSATGSAEGFVGPAT